MPKKRKRAAADRGKEKPQEEAQSEGESEPSLQEEMTTEYLSILESMDSTGNTQSGTEEEKMEGEEEADSDQDDSKGNRKKKQGKAAKSSAEPPKKKSPFENAFLSFIDERDKSAPGFGEPNRPRRGQNSSKPQSNKEHSLKDIRIQSGASDQLDIEKSDQSHNADVISGQSGASTSKDQSRSSNGSGKSAKSSKAKRRHSEVDEDEDDDPEWNPTQEKAPTNRLDMSARNSSGNSARAVSSSDDEISDDADMRRGPGRPPANATARNTGAANNDKKRPMQPPKVVIYPNKVVKTAASSSASGSRYTTITPNSSGPAPTSSNVVSSSVGSSNEMMSDEPLIISDAESESEEDSRMNYLREEFVVNTETLNDEKHPIWQIQKTLLKKFVPYQDKKHWYIASNSYLGWFGSEKSKFRPVRCRFVRKERNADIVKVVKPRRSANTAATEAAPDTTNEVQTSQQSLADSFKIYLQAAVSQVLDEEFLPCVEEERDEFFLTALCSLDERLEEAKRAVADNLGWVPRFKTLAETWPFLREEEGEPATGVLCQACEKQGHVAAKLLRLDGRPYDRLTLQDKDAPSGSDEQEKLLKLGRVCGERVSLYHRLHHYRFQLYRRCMAKVTTLQEEHPEFPQEEVVRQILKNINWVKQLYEELRSLLEDCQAVAS
uniref:DUF4211 domain-containing protein n=1 Tax=Branchiostoma floridae TaxID=7739 RepID=C3ZKJ0_BRAFL|eukprot:XP_002591078.1 hypothetical protein BRAFLDRAFT_69366 [Branchiostoma floridae]